MEGFTEGGGGTGEAEVVEETIEDEEAQGEVEGEANCAYYGGGEGQIVGGCGVVVCRHCVGGEEEKEVVRGHFVWG